MKKGIFGIAVALSAVLSACENITPQMSETSVSGADKVTISASLGPDTKTYLEQTAEDVFKLRWASDDVIYILDADVDYAVEDPNDYLSLFEISSGAGTSVAEFVLKDGYLPESHIAMYGDIWPIGNQWIADISEIQSRELYELNNGEKIQGFDMWEYPMYAKGIGRNIKFKNLFAVLKLSILGNGERLNSVLVSTLDEGVYLSGEAHLNFNGNNPRLELTAENIGDYEVDVYDYISFNPAWRENNMGELLQEAILSSDPIECYIVLPPQTYPSGLKIKLSTDNGYMEFTTDANLKFEASELREIPAFEYKNTESYEGKWTLNTWDMSDMPVIMVEEDGYYVARNYYAHGYLSLRDTFGNCYGFSEEYEGYNDNLINTCTQLQNYGSEIVNNIYVGQGYYDFYLDPEKEQLFIMTAGISPSSLPTLDNVVCQNYEKLRETMNEANLVKVHGVVSAFSTHGFIIHLKWDSSIFVDTFKSNIFDPEIQAQLAGLELGDRVDVYALNLSIFDGLPWLVDIRWIKVHKSDYPYENNQNMEDVYNGFSSTEYDYVKLYGVMSSSGSENYVIVNDGISVQARLYYPAMDVEQYVGKEVMMYGYYIGNKEQYINIVPTQIMLSEVEGSTEDVIPDEDIVIPTR